MELWSVSGASGASLGCSRHPLLSVPEQYNLAKPTVKPIENQMRPENSQYKTQYARNETNKSNEKPKETNEKTQKNNGKPNKTIEKPMMSLTNLAKTMEKPITPPKKKQNL